MCLAARWGIVALSVVWYGYVFTFPFVEQGEKIPHSIGEVVLMSGHSGAGFVCAYTESPLFCVVFAITQHVLGYASLYVYHDDPEQSVYVLSWAGMLLTTVLVICLACHSIVSKAKVFLRNKNTMENRAMGERALEHASSGEDGKRGDAGNGDAKSCGDAGNCGSCGKGMGQSQVCVVLDPVEDSTEGTPKRDRESECGEGNPFEGEGCVEVEIGDLKSAGEDVPH